MPEGCTFTPGKATLLRDGADVTLMACGVMVAPALEAAEILDSEGISARVVNVSSIKPIDATAIQEAVKMTGAIVSCEEHNIIGGLGAAIAEVLVQSTPAPMEMVGTKDTFGESGTPDALLEKYGLTAAHIVLAAKRVISRKSRV